MHIPSKLFDILKWVVMICIPACTVAFVGLDGVFSWGYGDIVAKVSSIVCTLLGTLLGLSSISFYKDGQIQPPDQPDEGESTP